MKPVELKAVRQFFNLSLQEAAQHLGGVSRQSWHYWETGKRTIPEDVKGKIRDLLRIRREQLEQITQLNREEISKIAVIFYDDVGECSSFMDWKFNNAQAAFLFAEYGVKLVRFEPEKYADWLIENGLIDSKAKRAEWASQQ